ncbi:hypothetical protein DM02DRAFT_721470 [Periconia macrospinosa]|uniref:2EXR domain-containing protein n=1 Tax=Periconia macrospinosa TaxID=97972 RepID=A0A2V1DA48_9PLEO|nr:hypothetical protein DM02DRAFT_721470 [Periconia macrospinosa]
MATFHPFPRLPFELRVQIWEMSVEPRTVQLRKKHRDPRYYRHPLWTSTTPVPAVLQVCREARYHGLYQMSFFSDVLAPDLVPRFVWVNLEIDIIDIGEALFEDYQSIAHFFRRLKFTREESNEVYYHWEVHDLRMFVNVKEMYVVCADGLDAWIGALEEHYWPCGDENVFFIDPKDDNRVFRGNEGLDQIADMIDWSSYEL